jgi:hypothetical protein
LYYKNKLTQSKKKNLSYIKAQVGRQKIAVFWFPRKIILFFVYGNVEVKMSVFGLPLASGEFLIFPEKILVKMRKNVIILTSMGYFYLTLFYRKGAGLDKMDFCCIWTEDISVF